MKPSPRERIRQSIMRAQARRNAHRGHLDVVVVIGGSLGLVSVQRSLALRRRVGAIVVCDDAAASD